MPLQALFSFPPNWFTPLERAFVERHLLHYTHDAAVVANITRFCPGVFATSFVLAGECLDRWLASGVFDAVTVASKEESMATERLVGGLSYALCGGAAMCPPTKTEAEVEADRGDDDGGRGGGDDSGDRRDAEDGWRRGGRVLRGLGRGLLTCGSRRRGWSAAQDRDGHNVASTRVL